MYGIHSRSKNTHKFCQYKFTTKNHELKHMLQILVCNYRLREQITKIFFFANLKRLHFRILITFSITGQPGS